MNPDNMEEIEMDENVTSTVYLKEEVTDCLNIEDFRERILPLLRTQQEQWREKINEIISQSGYSKTRFAELCEVSRMAVNNWCRETKTALPKNRETFLKIGMVAGYDRTQMDQFLQRYGRYPALYSKSLEDCVCIFVLEHYSGEERLIKYRYILNKIKESIQQKEVTEGRNISTDKFDQKLAEVMNEDELERFITENIATFTFAYHAFYVSVKIYIRNNIQRANESIMELAMAQSWSYSLRQAVYAIYQNNWFPTRNKIISLGIHLNMDIEQIDELLRCAYMEPLCAKNIFESAIMFILADAEYRGFMDPENENYDEERLPQYTIAVLKELGTEEFRPFIQELIGNEYKQKRQARSEIDRK